MTPAFKIRPIAALLVSLTMGSAVAAQTACNDSSIQEFQSSIAWEGSGAPAYTRLNLTPGTYDGFNTYCFKPGAVNWVDCVDNFGPRYRLVATSGVTQKWSVAICGRVRQSDGFVDFEHNVSSSATQNPVYYGARVRFQWQLSNGNWQTLRGGDGQALDFTLAPNTNTTLGWKGFSNTPRRWRVIVDQAMRNDQFDAVMDW